MHWGQSISMFYNLGTNDTIVSQLLECMATVVRFLSIAITLKI